MPVLRDLAEAERCRGKLVDAGYVPHGDPWKNWDLAHVLPEVNRGPADLLDMGCRGSYVLCNKRTSGRRVGIDLVPETEGGGEVDAIYRGDLCAVPEPSGNFDAVTCLSVLEHGVDVRAFADEAGRLLRPGGRLHATFDYWSSVLPARKRYGLPWLVLGPMDVLRLRAAMLDGGLRCDQEDELLAHLEPLDHEPPILLGGLAYTFMYLSFRKFA